MRPIDADALIANPSFFDSGDWHYGYLIRQIKKAPTIDAVPVVRCGECEYYDYRRCHHPNHDHHEQSVWVEEDHFCGWGQHREDGEA